MEFAILALITIVVCSGMRAFFARFHRAPQRTRTDRRVSAQSRSQALRSERNWYISKGGKA